MTAVLMLPWPPSVNSIIMCVRSRRIKSKTHKTYLDEARFQLAQQEPLPHFDKPVNVELRLGPPDRRKRDIDNHGKAALDALCDMNVLADDSLVHKLTLEWNPEVQGCMVLIQERQNG